MGEYAEEMILSMHGIDISEPETKIKEYGKGTQVRRSHVFCHECCKIQPANVCYMGGISSDGKHKHATDIVCSHCYFIIATLFNEIKD